VGKVFELHSRPGGIRIATDDPNESNTVIAAVTQTDKGREGFSRAVREAVEVTGYREFQAVFFLLARPDAGFMGWGVLSRLLSRRSMHESQHREHQSRLRETNANHPFDDFDLGIGELGSDFCELGPELAYEAGLVHGGRDEGAPGLRPHYAADYYGAYLRDPEGNKLHVVHRGGV